MDPGKAVLVNTAARLQRWYLFLGAFSYKIEYRGTQQHSSGDGLSRLPLPQIPLDQPAEVKVNH